MKQTYITLNNGAKIPQLGMGVFMVPAGDATRNACLEALKLGYRHIDTAHAYQNERGVGAAVTKSGLPREDVWITAKLWTSEYGEGKTSAAIDKMLDHLGTDHIELLLLHQQFGDYLGAWKDMERGSPRRTRALHRPFQLRVRAPGRGAGSRRDHAVGAPGGILEPCALGP